MVVLAFIRNFTPSWFETGDITRQIFREAAEKYEVNDGDTLEVTATNSLMQQCSEKWRAIEKTDNRLNLKHILILYCNIFAVIFCNALVIKWTDLRISNSRQSGLYGMIKLQRHSAR